MLHDFTERPTMGQALALLIAAAKAEFIPLYWRSSGIMIVQLEIVLDSDSVNARVVNRRAIGQSAIADA